MAQLVEDGRSEPDPDAVPDAVFLDWLGHAIDAGVAEPHVAVLATVDGSGAPDARVLLLRDVTADGWWFSGPSFSPKGRQLAANPAAALTFYWSSVGRQVRIAGRVSEGSAAAVARDFHERSRTAKAVATASRQSEVLSNEGDYAARVDEAATELDDHPDQVPEHWRAWCLEADTVEFWQAEPGRRHQRWRYRRTSDGWLRETLWP
ncbi:pyridoxal 5'-phosphate synthase [Antrihabitans sp. YC3-6]|uniref:Pyridoxal 5'-phosphate synthase n=1 Tax=Antrihabitans stalagmiti TaxID=2799499 RepID=A0A934NSH9_9NOCA|nr:pyridoxal 5'-phosphate synthase [Antrihabitans stalagmiti]MBJ8340495.1 pyridoxal 5'-phosphate synthase [Antrihabitans stalagmiti]